LTQPTRRGALSHLWDAVLDLVFPPRCAGCGRVDHLLCSDCRQSIVWVAPPFCPRCARAVAAPVTASPSECQARCLVCATRPLQIDGVRAVVEFEGVIQGAIHALKYKGRTDLASPLAELMVTFWNGGLFPVDCIVPVPLHPRRLRERGYNQAALIADKLAREINLPILPDVLVRSRMTETQTRLDTSGRRKNVAGAFTAHPSQVGGRSVLLIDDVCTTGSTLQACADALRVAGAAQVYAMTLARAGWDPDTGAARDVDYWQNQHIF